MLKYVLPVVLFAAPLYVYAYDYDALPQRKESKEKPISYEEAYPDLSKKSTHEIEDIDAKLSRVIKQAKYERQQKAKKEAEQKAAKPTEQQENSPEAAAIAEPQKDVQEAAKPAKKHNKSPKTVKTQNPVLYHPKEDIDVKLDNNRKQQKPSKQPESVREIWLADPATGLHDWGAAPAEKSPQKSNSEEALPKTTAETAPQK